MRRKGDFLISKAQDKDLDAVAEIYSHIHDFEEAGKVEIGWDRAIYPTRNTAQDALKRGDLFVLEDDQGKVVATAIINDKQVAAYAQGNWEYSAKDDEVMVLHTLAVDPYAAHRGYGKAFVAFYEDYARKAAARFLRMDTNAHNKNARAMYKKLGYKEIGIVPCEFNGLKDVPLVLLEKKL